MNRYVANVMSDGSAAAGGMHDGDLVKEVDGKPISNWEEFVGIIQDSPGIPLQLVVERDGTLETLDITPSTIKEKDQEYGQIGVITRPMEKNPIKAVAVRCRTNRCLD